jgi:hypothetical protein
MHITVAFGHSSIAYIGQPNIRFLKATGKNGFRDF